MNTVAGISNLDIDKIRRMFPVLHQQVNGRELVYFDNAATTQKPKSVINELVSYYEGYNANIHRGIHTLAERATKAFEDTRTAARDFLGARHKEEIIFTTGVTGGINLVAYSYARHFLDKGDEIIITGMEHHSNIVPWQMACEEKGAVLKVIPVSAQGELDMEVFQTLLTGKTKIVALNHASNSLGSINPVAEVTRMSHDAGAVVLIDGAQAAAHIDINVRELDCDFYCISGHKMYGPTGVGVLYGKKDLLEKMPPFLGGGEMIRNVTFAKTTYNDIPYKFEAGTPNIADVIALRAAIEFVDGLGKTSIARHEQDLLDYGTKLLSGVAGLKIIGTAKHKVSVISFNIEGVHPFDIGQMLDARGIAVRTGHHCTQPLMEGFGIEGTVRASFAVYNTRSEIDRLAEGVSRVVRFMKP